MKICFFLALRDDEIEEILHNLDDSDVEDVVEDEEEIIFAKQENISEEVVPRSVDGSEWDTSDEETLASIAHGRSTRRSTDRPLLWERTNIFNSTSSNSQVDPILIDPTTTTKYSDEYFYHYIKPEFFEHMSHCTNISSTYRTGRSLNTNPEEMRTFVGASMAIGVLGLPRIRMFWADETRALLVANAITRDRYFQLRNNIKVVDDQLITPSMKAVDRFWKIRPLVSTIEHGCRQNERSQNVAIDEQIIPFTGKCKMKQVVKGKPNPEGMKVFIMANPNGLPLDLFFVARCRSRYRIRTLPNAGKA